MAKLLEYFSTEAFEKILLLMEECNLCIKEILQLFLSYIVVTRKLIINNAVCSFFL